jgi:UDP-2-acetamido-3-amino-2,3-dideoxy-glucuronate N-acetyltransferase
MPQLIELNGIKIHPSAEVSEKAIIGSGTYIWNQVQVRENCTIGSNCILSKDVYIDFDVIIGNNVKIQNGVSVYHGVEIEDDVFLGPHMVFTNDLYPRAYIGDFKVYKTIIKKGASIGANATIVCGTTIGNYAMIGAGSVITKDVPNNALVVGNPGKIIGFVGKQGQKLIKLETTLDAVIMRCPVSNEVVTIPFPTYNLLK